jgi:DNA-binding transcriptional LysR family regulator
VEGRHGAKLFHRVGRRIELTEAGALFLAEARAVLARAESAELVLSELGDLKSGVLSIHASQTITGYWLPRHLAASVAPIRASRRLSMVNTRQTATAVRGGEADLGFVEGEVNVSCGVVAGRVRDLAVGIADLWITHSWGASGIKRAMRHTACQTTAPSFIEQRPAPLTLDGRAA